jgi:phosphoribosylformylglycinamidine (FGAM) synthase-like amidotransferase family enzyme
MGLKTILCTKKYLTSHSLKIPIGEHDGRSFFHFFIEIENFRVEGKILMRHTHVHDTSFSEKILDFYTKF